MHFLVIDPSTVGTMFVWAILIGFVAVVGYCLYGANKKDKAVYKRPY